MTGLSGPARELHAPWTYVPRRGPGREGDPTLRMALEAALRSGHGLGAAFRLEISGGESPDLRVASTDPRSEAWLERALLPAWGPGLWRRGVPSRVRPAAPGWRIRRWGPSSPEPGDPSVPGRLALAIATALRACPGVPRLTVDFRPSAPSLADVLDRWSPPARAGPAGRPPPRGTPGPRARTEAEPPPPPLRWSAEIALGLGAGSPEGAERRAIAALGSAWSATDGSRIRVSPNPGPPLVRQRSVFSETELVALLPSPATFPGPPALPREGGTILPIGRGVAGTVVGLPVEPDEGRHFAVLGETGMGKSSLLVAIARRSARFGTVVLLDPLGETAERLRVELTEAGAAPVWIAPTARGGELNALDGIGRSLRRDPVAAERRLESLTHALRRVRAGRYSEGPFWGPRLEEMLERALRAAAAVPGATLEDAHALLARTGAGRVVVPPEASTEARELEARLRDRPEDAEGARRLLFEIVRNPTLRRMLCSRTPSVDVGELLAGSRAVIVSGAASVVGEATARYLLATFLALVWSEILARGADRKTFLLLDEAQWFAHESFGEMLRLARRRNVHVGVATQSLGSLAEDLQEAVRTNVADRVVFRGAPEEALALARSVPAVPADTLLGLGRGEAIALIGKAEEVRWIRTARLPQECLGRAGSAARGPGPSGEPAGTGPADEPAGGLWTWIRERAREARAGELIEVDVGALRADASADERAIREAGGELGRRGAIVRTERRGGRPVWWLEPSRLPGRERARDTAARVPAAEPTQRL